VIDRPPRFSPETPTASSLAADYDRIDAALEAARDDAGLIAAVENWDALRRRLSSWVALVQLRFRQDTRDPEANAARRHCEELTPQVLARETLVKRRLLEHPRRVALEAKFGEQAFRLWESDARTYAPALDDDLVREAEVVAEYNSLIGGIVVEFDGRRMTFGEVRGYANALDRSVRHAAERVRWTALSERGVELDRIYVELVRLRDRMG
jgi:oligoendopeptidase F